jgi:LmbE family N-acetylglucosaminyl deacetylase
MRYVRPMVPAPALMMRLHELPLVDPGKLVDERGVLVIAPHPDDESLGCGGLIAACRERGLVVRVVLWTDGSASHPRSRAYPPERLAALRREEAHAAGAALGVLPDQIVDFGLADGQAPLSGGALHRVADRIVAELRAHDIGTVCTTWLHDPHPDHLSAYRAARLAARQTGARVLCYPVWSWTLPEQAWLPAEPVSGARIDVGPFRARKRQAIDCHRSQIEDLITDDPMGFRLTPEQLALFDRPYEVFIDASP